MAEEIRQLEVRMLRWSDSSTAGRTATFELDPLDGIEHPLRHYQSGAKNGQRFRVLIAPISDDESSALPDVQEVAPARLPEKTVDPGKSERAKESYRSLDAMGQAVTRASLLCKDREFQRCFEVMNETDAARLLRMRLQINSRSEIGTDERAYQEFLNVEYQFQHRDDPEPR